MIGYIRFITCATIALWMLMSLSFAQFSDTTEEALVPIEENYGYVLASSIWQFNSGNQKKEIPVCWENPSANYIRQMWLVQTSIQSSWQHYSALEFIGWEQCPETNFRGIRIHIANQHPHVKNLGSSLSNVTNGMVLNFDFNLNGFRVCRNETNSLEDRFFHDLCIQSIAVHEFGHALGFAHEHNRYDRDESCFEKSQGSNGTIVLTPYDPHSVMNYCNPAYSNYGRLSHYDVLSLQKIYGAP